jgi:hypothetical protein
MAWESSETIGLVATGAALVGGMFLQTMTNSPIILQAARAASISGASTFGWVGAEKFLIEASAGRMIGHLPAQQAIGGSPYLSGRAAYAGNGLVHRAMVPYDDDVTVL